MGTLSTHDLLMLKVEFQLAIFKVVVHHLLQTKEIVHTGTVYRDNVGCQVSMRFYKNNLAFRTIIHEICNEETFVIFSKSLQQELHFVHSL